MGGGINIKAKLSPAELKLGLSLAIWGLGEEKKFVLKCFFEDSKGFKPMFSFLFNGKFHFF